MSPLDSEKFITDLNFLMECFEEILEERGQSEFKAFLPKAKRGKAPETPKALPSVAQQEKTAQLLSIAFQLLNMAEENTLVQNRRKMQAAKHLEKETGLWPDNLKRLVEHGVSPKEIKQLLHQVNIDIVLTAHPTEAKRSTVLEHHRELYLKLVGRENQMWSAVEQNWLREDIKAILERLWRTGEIYQERPDLASERRNVMHYLRNVFPEIIPLMDRRFQTAWQLSDIKEPISYIEGDFPKVTFGTWVGGDRDGHPFVTADVTWETLNKLRLNALIVIRHRLVALARKASFSEKIQKPTEELLKRLEVYQTLMPEFYKEAEKRNPGEPWRILISSMIERLPIKVVRDHATKLEDTPQSYRNSQDLMEDLKVLYRSFVKIGAERLTQGNIRDAVRCLQIFGFHTAALDIRQNSQKHRDAFEALLSFAGLKTDDQSASYLSQTELDKMVENELVCRRPLALPNQSYDGALHEVLSCYETLKRYSDQYGFDGIGSLIVSMTRSATDLFTVYLLAREAGLLFSQENDLVCPIPVVPLFETIEDLKASPEIMDRFLSHPLTQASLEYHRKAKGLEKKQQQIMIGYSDSCKDGGILSSQWNLFLAQRKLQEIAASHGVEVCFFHGRGGTVSRGAGPIHRFLQALPKAAVNGKFRMTEQGETISQKYANFQTAIYNLEMLTANLVTETGLAHQRTDLDETFFSTMDFLSEESFMIYRDLVTDPDFPDFFAQATPIDVLQVTRIGSRPPKRTGKATIDDLRAIPWVFSWNQSRFYLPSWYGVGSALKALESKDKAIFGQIQQNISQFSLLNYVLNNVETTVASASPEIMGWYADLVEDSKLKQKFMKKILQEYQLTKSMLAKVFGVDVQQRRPHVTRSIELREPSLRLLHQLQIDQIKRWRTLNSKGEESRELIDSMLITINAIAGGLRNTG